MKPLSFNDTQQQASGFDLARLHKSKDAVDVSPNTLRAYNKQGLPFYRRGKAVFFSKTELEQFIRNPDSFRKTTKSKR